MPGSLEAREPATINKEIRPSSWLAPLGAPPAVGDAIGNDPIQGGTVGTGLPAETASAQAGLAACKYLWESGS